MFWLKKRLKALVQLGLSTLVWYAWYRIVKCTGYLRWRTPPGGQPAAPVHLNLAKHLFPLPDPATLLGFLGQEGLAQLISEANEILQGQVRVFGKISMPLHFKAFAQLQHWTAYAHGIPNGVISKEVTPRDIKFIWEPGRFGWAIILARAYHITKNEAYAQYFWQQFESFQASNPPNLGPHWASAQEVALRLVALVFACQVFAASPTSTPKRQFHLAQAMADHAARIPPSLSYARAQHNNHLISEALGLYTAGLVLPAHPQSAKWQESGWRLLNKALQNQIAPTGAYIQHATNYHRLVLHAALWANCLAQAQGVNWYGQTRERLAAATRWLLALCDPVSGLVPNLGPNDGALILPLSTSAFGDYRPALQAASRAFLGQNSFCKGPWNEAAAWLGLSETINNSQPLPTNDDGSEPHCLHAPDGQSWAYVRMARFTSRPGHADQLHLDLWWQGTNLAQDPGTYRYSAESPWDNNLTHTAVHNTLTINGLEQMTRAGRFLYLDWAQAHLVGRTHHADGRLYRIAGMHDGYRRLHLQHQRSVECHVLRWIITDQVLPTRSAPANHPASVRVHWLLPDFPWEIEPRSNLVILRLQSKHGWITLSIRSSQAHLLPQLVRAGSALVGEHPGQPTWGWTSPTYGYKIPALSFSVTVDAIPPLEITSIWDLPSS